MTFDRLVVGCGYVGQRAAEFWRDAGLNVAVTTRSPERAQKLEAAGLHPFVCNVLDLPSLRPLPAARTVLHAVGFDRESGQSQREVYVDGLSNLLEGLDGRFDQFIHISSTSVYGQTDGAAVNEEAATIPSRDNGRVVLDAELLLRDRFEDAVILRLAGIYGPDRLLARVLQRKDNQPIPGNPDAWLNLIHQTDIVRAIDAVVEKQLQNELFLVADDEPIRRRDFYTLLASLIGAAEPTFEPSLSDPKGDRGANKRCDNTKLHQLLLPELTYPTVREGLPDAIGS